MEDSKDLISRLSEIRSQYNCFNEPEEPYYRALSEVIKMLSEQADGDTISRQAAIDALDVLCQEHRYRIPGKRETYSQYNEAWQDALDRAENAIGNLPPAQPEQGDEAAFWKKRAREYEDMVIDHVAEQAKGIKFDSIEITGEGVAFKKSQPEQRWIPWNSGKFPEESGIYTVTAYDGATKRVTYAKYQKRLKRWELTGARAYWRVLAWMPLPEPWKGEAK